MANLRDRSLLKTFTIECEQQYTEQQSAITQLLNELFGSLSIEDELIDTAKQYLAAQSTSFDTYTSSNWRAATLQASVAYDTMQTRKEPSITDATIARWQKATVW